MKYKKKIDRLRNKPSCQLSLKDRRDTTELNRTLEYKTFKVLLKRQSKMFAIGIFQLKDNAEKNLFSNLWIISPFL